MSDGALKQWREVVREATREYFAPLRWAWRWMRPTTPDTLSESNEKKHGEPGAG